MSKATRHPPPIEDDPRALVRERLNGELAAIRDGVAVAARSAGIYDETGVDDLLGEVVRQVMEQAGKYDAGRAVVPWAMGFLKNILAERRRKRSRRSREIAAADLSVDADVLFEGLQAAAQKQAVAGELDPHRWLQKLSEPDRHIIVCRFFQDLRGAALAVAIGADTPGAARTQVCRALKKLREIAHAEGGLS
ncbi:MAG: hypothetical protein KY475_27020 [Planctomycetes bacterium]|nr:hypothetical protein [Planctomycetota bacterium]